MFDGTAKQLSQPMSVLILGNKIAKIGESIATPEGAKVIDAKGHTLTPGFIAVHEHLVGQMSFGEVFSTDSRYKAYVATQTVHTYLMNGFTTVRDEPQSKLLEQLNTGVELQELPSRNGDLPSKSAKVQTSLSVQFAVLTEPHVCGDTYSLKTVIDRGLIAGPRIYPSGPMISQTSGHSDHRTSSNKPKLIGGTDDVMVLQGDMVIVDGVPEVLEAVRENLAEAPRKSRLLSVAVQDPTPTRWM